MSDLKDCKTTCPYCGVGCGIIASFDENGIKSVKGDPDHPANYGRLCSKGSALAETMSMDDRLLTPEFKGEEISWDAALDKVAGEFSAAIAEHGPDSVAFYVSGQILTEDYYVANKLMKGFIGSANIDTNSRLCMASSVAGHRKAFGADTVPGTYEDLELADLLILTGSNLAWCHPVLFQRIKAAKEARPEIKVVLIDPRKTMTAEIADLHLPIDLDGDVALFGGLLNYLNQNKVLDQAYIDQHTNGFDAAINAVADLDIEKVASLISVEAKLIATFYDWFKTTERTVTVYSQGVNQSVEGTNKVNAIINCHLATGRIGRPGMGPFSVTGQPNAMGGREVGGLANMLAAHMAIENKDHRDLVQGFWQSPVMADKPGLKAVELFDAVDEGKIKALWIMATNPVDSLPNASLVERALEKCPFVVVSDIYRNTDTVKYADMILPALGWGEKDGTVTNSERRISRQKAFLPAPGAAKADWWQLAEVGKRMGFAKDFNYEGPAAIFREHAALSAHQNHGRRDFDIGAFSHISNDSYDELDPFQWPMAAGTDPTETRFFANGGFFTEDKKANFIPTSTGRSKIVWDDGRLSLNTGRIRDQWHTMTRTGRTSRLCGHLAEPYVEISPEDARKHQIRDADIVVISNNYGSVLMRSLITDRVQEGSVFAPIHWTDQVASNARIDKLVHPVTDPFSGQPASKNVPVTIRKMVAQSYAYLLFAEKPNLPTSEYWALSPVTGGWQLEIATDVAEVDLEALFAECGVPLNILETVQYTDAKSGEQRLAAFAGSKLAAVGFMSNEPVQVSRSWAASLLGEDYSVSTSRFYVVAGRAGGDVEDKGAMICSCFGVGALQIERAVIQGNMTVAAIGKCLHAGTNCGSCKSEIAQLIDRNMPIAAE